MLQTAETWLRHPTVAKMISFGVIGVANAVIDFGVFSIAYQVLKTFLTSAFAIADGVLDIPLALANVIAWMVAVSCSYVMNTMITFRAESGRVLRWKDYSVFAASGLLGMITNTATLLLLSKVMPVYAAKICAIFTAFVVNFAMSHFVVFRTKPRA
ncbi:GtrA family protein [Tardiphaga sp.]|uniref:GtrA family protein n=1 Tax=Tardiphaga sp. TaxID=1926292 RepID=UPI0037DA720E